jgi:hypothetical protein
MQPSMTYVEQDELNHAALLHTHNTSKKVLCAIKAGVLHSRVEQMSTYAQARKLQHHDTPH